VEIFPTFIIVMNSDQNYHYNTGSNFVPLFYSYGMLDNSGQDYLLSSQSQGAPNNYGAPHNSGSGFSHLSQFYSTPDIPSQTWAGQMDMPNANLFSSLVAGTFDADSHEFDEGSSEPVRISHIYKICTILAQTNSSVCHIKPIYHPCLF
jgi:hypothetical protein